MDTALATIAGRETAFSTLSLTPSAVTVLDRAFEPGAVFSDQDIALIEPIAAAIAVPQVADERCIRQSLGGLAAALPSQSTDATAGKLKLATYLTMLDGCDERALAHACRRCLDELDWMPTVHQLKERMVGWVSPEDSAIRRARAILRTGRREQRDCPPITPEQIRAMKPEFRSMGLTAGFITQEQIDAALDDQQLAA